MTELNTPNQTECNALEHELTPYERLVGKFSDKDIQDATDIYHYIMGKNNKIFGDVMWIQNCYRPGGWPKYLQQPDPECHVCEPRLSEEQCKVYQEEMNGTVYTNLLESDSIVKENSDYCFVVSPADECKLLSYTSDD